MGAALTGCGGGGTLSELVVCQPACPAGTTCTKDGCILDGSGPDFGVSQKADAGDRCGGACGGATPKCNAGGVCVACLVDDDCPSGSVCRAVGAGAVCLPGCNDSSRCNGATCCGGACTDTATDPGNCGGCGMACGGQHATATCEAGACKTGVCDAGWGDCTVDAEGCETNLHADAANCGACGTICSLPKATAGCSGGACYVKACAFGWDDCNGEPVDGCEITVLADNRNCGACRNPCTNPPHARTSCINAACQLTSCDQGFADCDGVPNNGCEVTTASDKANCGACGNACAQGLVCANGGCTCPQCNIPNAKSKCVNNNCVLDACLPDFADCNDDPKDGCEKAVGFDKLNCGACGNACPMGQVCINSQCSICNGNVLVIGDNQAQANQDLVDAINASGLHAELVMNGSVNYAGKPDPNDYGAVVILIGDNYNADMPAAGQQAILDAQGKATGVVTSEWFAFEISQGRYQTLKPLLLLQRAAGVTQTLTYTSEVNHPIWANLPNSFRTMNSLGANTGAQIVNNGTRIAKCTECTDAGVVVRDDGAGRVVQYSYAADYTAGGAGGATMWKDANLVLMTTNAIRWATRCM